MTTSSWKFGATFLARKAERSEDLSDLFFEQITQLHEDSITRLNEYYDQLDEAVAEWTRQMREDNAIIAAQMTGLLSDIREMDQSFVALINGVSVKLREYDQSFTEQMAGLSSQMKEFDQSFTRQMTGVPRKIDGLTQCNEEFRASTAADLGHLRREYDHLLAVYVGGEHASSTGTASVTAGADDDLFF